MLVRPTPSFASHQIGVTSLDKNSSAFDGTSTTNLTYTPTSASDQLIWSMIIGFRLSEIETLQDLFAAGTGSTASTQTIIRITSDGSLAVLGGNGGEWWRSAKKFKDPNAFYMVMFNWDVTQATGTNRIKAWDCFTSEQLDYEYSAGPTQNFAYSINSNVEHRIGRSTNTSSYYSGTISHFEIVAGIITVTDFMKFDDTVGVYKYTGYKGARSQNDVTIDFENGLDLGNDVSGQANDFTVNGSVEATTDSPSSTKTSLNVLIPSSGYDYSDNNLTYSLGGTNKEIVASSLAMPESGVWYCEIASPNSNDVFGIYREDTDFANDTPVHTEYCYVYAGWTGQKWNNSTNTAYGATFNSSDIIGIKFDRDNDTLEFFKNGVSQGNAWTDIPAGKFMFGGGNEGGSAGGTFRFEFDEWTQTPSGITAANALTLENIPTPIENDVSQHFETILYNGDGATSRNVTISDWGSDDSLIIYRCRTAAYNSILSDTLRGITLGNKLDVSDAAEQEQGGYISSLSGSTMTLQQGANNNFYHNKLNEDYVAWRWRAGVAYTETVKGDIDAEISHNPVLGFSIVKYTANGVVGATVPHGGTNGKKPAFILVKGVDAASNGWVYHKDLGATKYLYLSGTQAALTGSAAWNNTEPTSDVFSLGSTTHLNQSGKTYSAYVFWDSDFIDVGSYSGNGLTDGAYVNMGGSPVYTLTKIYAGGTANWYVQDSYRNPFNPVTHNTRLNAANIEDTDAITYDAVSTGLKRRTATNNVSGDDYIYLAIKESFGGTIPLVAK